MAFNMVGTYTTGFSQDDLDFLLHGSLVGDGTSSFSLVRFNY